MQLYFRVYIHILFTENRFPMGSTPKISNKVLLQLKSFFTKWASCLNAGWSQYIGVVSLHTRFAQLIDSCPSFGKLKKLMIEAMRVHGHRHRRVRQNHSIENFPTPRRRQGLRCRDNLRLRLDVWCCNPKTHRPATLVIYDVIKAPKTAEYTKIASVYAIVLGSIFQQISPLKLISMLAKENIKTVSVFHKSD